MAWPFIGREAESRAFRTALRSGKAGAVLIGGAGVGKSRLASELTIDLGGPPSVLIGASASSSRIPMGAFVTHLESLGHSYESEATLLAAASRELSALDAILIVDDAHHLDPLSATLLHQALPDRATPTVVTARTGEETPPAVTALWKEGLLSRIDVGPLTEESTRHLVESVLEGGIDPLLLDALWDLSRGNVLYLRHLLEGATADGVIRRAAGVWTLTAELSPPERLVDLLWQEIERTETALVLKAVAVMEPLEFDLLTSLGGTDAVATAEEATMIQVHREDQRVFVSAAHPLFPEIAKKKATEVAMRAVCRDVAAFIETSGMRRESDILRVARLRLDAGAGVPLDIGLNAARTLLRLFDFEFAERVLAVARQSRDSHEARVLHARSLRFLGRTDQALATLEADLLLGSEDEAAGAATLAIDTLLFSGRVDEAKRLADWVLSKLADPIARGKVASEASLLSAVTGNVDAAVDIGEPVLVISDLPDLVRLGVLITVTVGQCLAGRLHEVHERIDVGLELAKLEDAPPLAVHQLTLNRQFAYQCEGRMSEAAEVGIGHWREVAESTGPIAVVGMVTIDTLFERAEFDEMLGLSEVALADVERFDPFANRPHIHLWAASLALQIDRDDLAADWERHAFEAGTDIRWLVRRHRVDAWRAASEEDLETAGHHYERAADAAGKGGNRMWLLYGLGDAIRLGEPQLVIGHLDRLAEVMDGEAVELFSRHAHALQEGDGATLDQLSVRYRELGWILRSAEAAADAARAHSRSGDEVASRRSAVRATVISQGFTATTPPLRDIPDGLTDRELEVALLAAFGLSNQEIADRVYVSYRTVENHLSHVYHKLEIPDRSHLGEVIPDPGE
ncbi:MAG: LuxR C-terminal-related transcriptional regulator [Actinomycetota bacterium]